MLEINNVIEGKSEKILNQVQEHLDNKKPSDPTSPEEMEKVMKVFSSIQMPMDKKREEAEFYKDKNYFEVEIKDKFKTSPEQGQQTFNRLTGSIASRHDDFDFFSEQKTQQSASSGSIPSTNSEIIQDVKQNPNN